MSFSIENCRFKWKISTVHWKSTFATGKSSKKVCESEFKWVKRGENCKSSSNWCQMLLRHYACGWLNLRFSHVNFCFFHFSLSQAESSFNPFFRFWAHLLQLSLGSFNNYVDIIFSFCDRYLKVSQSYNVLMKWQFLPKYQRNYFWISALKFVVPSWGHFVRTFWD